jgi:hypothetical protein
VVELKKDVHEDVWNAAETQLDRLYTRDPEAARLGIYGVFWFGEKRESKLPSPPAGVVAPNTATEMARTLRELLPEATRERIDVIVFDVSGPTGLAAPLSRTNRAQRRKKANAEKTNGKSAKA